MAIANDPVCGMEVDTDDLAAVLRVRRHDLLVLRQGLPARVQGRPRQVPRRGLQSRRCGPRSLTRGDARVSRETKRPPRSDRALRRAIGSGTSYGARIAQVANAADRRPARGTGGGIAMPCVRSAARSGRARSRLSDRRRPSRSASSATGPEVAVTATARGRAGAVADPGRDPDRDHGQDDQDQRHDVDDGQLVRALDGREDPHRDGLRAGAGREVRDDDLVERQGEGEQRRPTAAPCPCPGSVTRRNVVKASAPRSADASSGERGSRRSRAITLL